MRRLAEWQPDQIVAIDESVANEHTLHRKQGWAPIGADPVAFQPAKRSERYSILPAYTINGILEFYVYQGLLTEKTFDM